MSNIPKDKENTTETNIEKGVFGDLPDSPADAEKMKSDTIVIDLPEVKDIPGQEHVQVMPLGEMADTTISSDDEEGRGIEGFDDLNDDAKDEEEINAGENDDNLISDTSVNVSQTENELLDEAGTAIPDDLQLKQAALDNVDEEGEPLNEGSSSGANSVADLDVPGSETDDANEAIGEEDEENNDYSLPDPE